MKACPNLRESGSMAHDRRKVSVCEEQVRLKRGRLQQPSPKGVGIMARKTFWIAPALALGVLAGCQQAREIEIEPTPGQPGARIDDERPTGEVVEDAALTASVKGALIASPQVGALEIDVNTTGNVVTLKGTVESAEQKRLAEDIARGVEGVQRVINELAIEVPESG
jgi:hypothetical protein